MTEIYGPDPVLARMELEFFQDGNTMGTTGDVETLRVQFETQVPGEEPFLVLRSDGWSVDGPAEFLTFLEVCYGAWQQAAGELGRSVDDRTSGR